MAALLLLTICSLWRMLLRWWANWPSRTQRWSGWPSFWDGWHRMFPPDVFAALVHFRGDLIRVWDWSGLLRYDINPRGGETLITSCSAPSKWRDCTASWKNVLPGDTYSWIATSHSNPSQEPNYKKKKNAFWCCQALRPTHTFSGLTFKNSVGEILHWIMLKRDLK